MFTIFLPRASRSLAVTSRRREDAVFSFASLGRVAPAWDVGWWNLEHSGEDECVSYLWRHICYLSPVPRSGSTLVWLAPTAPGPPPPSSVGKYLRHPATWQHVGAEGPCQPFRKEPLIVLSLSVLSLMCGAFCLSITEPGEIFSGIIMLCSS